MYDREILREGTLNKHGYWLKIQQRGREKVKRLQRTEDGREQLEAELRLEQDLEERQSLEAGRRARRDSGSSMFPPATAWRWWASLATSTSPSTLAPSPRLINPSRRYFFLSFPPEVRNLIYEKCVAYPDCQRLFDAYYTQQKARKKGCRNKVRLCTPTILLLCKQVTNEALGILGTCTFVLDRLPPWVMGNSAPLPIQSFISPPTLRRVRFMELRFGMGQGQGGSGIVWLRVLARLLQALSTGHSLVQLKILIKLSNVEVWGTWHTELLYYQLLHDMVNDWELKFATRPSTVQFEYWVIDREHAYKTGFRNPLVRTYPDRKLWVGDILEFL